MQTKKNSNSILIYLYHILPIKKISEWIGIEQSALELTQKIASYSNEVDKLYVDYLAAHEDVMKANKAVEKANKDNLSKCWQEVSASLLRIRIIEEKLTAKRNLLQRAQIKLSYITHNDDELLVENVKKNL